ncbi:MAG: transglutaminase-like domain-containing protein, partial [Candidatus Acidiferrales bacterium]
MGSIVGYEVIQKERPFLLEDEWYFQTTIPEHRSRLTLQLPPGWQISALFVNAPEQKAQTPRPNEYTWELTDQPAIEVEPEMPAWNAVAGHMYLKYFPRDSTLREKTTGTWQDIGVWYSGLIASQRVPTPAIQQKVAELTAGKPDLLSKIQALASYSQQQIRYAAIEVGIGGMQPHAAGDVLANGYGDCKDKATLLNTMLKVIGVDSYNVMINSRRGRVAPQFPMVIFDHSIVAIHLPDSVPDGGLFAVVNDPKLGRLLFFDPTDTYVPLGYLPWEEQDDYALVVTPEGGTLEHVPLLPPATNRLLRTATLNLSSTGNLSGEFREISWGGPAEGERGQFLGMPPAQRAKIIEGFLGNFLDNFTITHASIGNLDLIDQNMLVTYSVNVNAYAKSAG